MELKPKKGLYSVFHIIVVTIPGTSMGIMKATLTIPEILALRIQKTSSAASNGQNMALNTLTSVIISWFFMDVQKTGSLNIRMKLAKPTK